jgi:hypothetical protein
VTFTCQWYGWGTERMFPLYQRTCSNHRITLDLGPWAAFLVIPRR